MVKAKAKGNASTPGSKPEKKDETNNVALITEAEPEVEQMDEEVPAVVTGAEEKAEAENNNDGETQLIEDGGEPEENKDGEKMEEDKNTENVEENKNEEKAEEDKKEGTDKEQVEKTPAKQGKRQRRRKKKKPTKGAADVKPADAKAAEGTDKPEASAKEQNAKKADSKGMIFMCSSKTKKDCYQYKVLGLPAGKKEVVASIYQGMRLFLFDIDVRMMYGIYKAAAPGGYNIEPKAFKSAFPAQVKFSVMEDCLPLDEETFKAAIKKNYYGKNKFKCELDAEQVKNLCKLFKAKGRKSKQDVKPSRQDVKPSRQEVRGRRDRDRRGPERVRRNSFGGGRGGQYREPVRAYAPAILPPPISAARPLYVYDRPLESDYYRRGEVVDRHDRRLAELDHDRRLDVELIRDPYMYREPLPYHESSYPVGPPAGPPPGYYLPPPQYRY